jgi:putrescine transport system permease protein
MTRGGGSARWFALGWFMVLLALPLLTVFAISFAGRTDGVPPYRPILSWLDGDRLVVWLDLAGYRLILADDIYRVALFNALGFAAATTAICLVVGLPMALAITRAGPGARAVLLTLVMLPFWTSLLVRVYAWKGVMQESGPMNAALIGLGLISEPLIVLTTPAAVLIGLVHGFLPFMVLPLFARLTRLDPDLLDAAADLGAGPVARLWRVVLPLARPGIIAGCLLVFVPCVGEFVVPDLLGGSDTVMIGGLIWTEFFQNRDWPVASAVTVLLALLLVGPILALGDGRRGARP